MRQLKITQQITRRDGKSIDKYLNDISKYPMVTADEEVVLAKKIKEGDEIAFAKLIEANLRFVVSVSKKYQNMGLTLSDLINQGNLGLIKAARRFDETRGFKFISYAVWWIRQSILQALAEQGRMVRLPFNQLDMINKATKAYSKLEQEFEREPTINELAEVLEVDHGKVADSMKASSKQVSLDAPVKEGEDTSLMDFFSDINSPRTDNGLMIESLKKEISRLLNTLPEQEKEVLKLNFGIDKNEAMTLQEISDRFNISSERVRQIKRRAIHKLKKGSKSKLLRPFLG